MKIATPRAASFYLTGALACLFVLLSLYPNGASADTPASISDEPLTATVTITRAKSFTEDCLFAGNQDMYAKLQLNGQSFRTDTQGIKGDDLNPTNWRFTVPVDPAVEEIPVRLELWEEDAGTCGGGDEFDIFSGAGSALDLMLNIRTCVVRGSIEGACWRTLTGGEGTTGKEQGQIWFNIDVNLPRTTFWGHIYEGVPPSRSNPLSGHQVSVVDTSLGIVLDSSPTDADGKFAFNLPVLPDRPLQLIVEDCNGLVSCTFSTPDIAEIPIQPLSNDTRSVTYPGCAPGQTCLYAPVDFFLERTGQDIGAASLTGATPSKPSPFYVVRDNPVQTTDPTVTLWGSNLHTWIEVYLYEGNCTNFPACQRYSARVMERAPDGSFIKIQMPALDNVDVFKSTWFWAIHDALPRTQYNEWVRLPRFVMNFAAVHGFRFENEADKATLGDFDGVYGNNAYICIGAFGFCPLRVRDPVYLLFYATAYKPWVSAGTCEGMAALSALLEQKQVDPGSWEAGVRFAAGFSGAGPDGSLPPKPATYRNPTFDPRSPTNLWGLLRTYHGVQTSAEFIQEFFRDSGGGFLSFSIAGDPNARLAELRNNPSGQIICMTPKPGKGHCVTPYAVEDVDDTHSRIWVYDNNYPAQNYGDDRPTEFNAYIEIDRATNRYVYKPRPTEFLGTGLHTYPISLWQNERHMPGISEIKDLVYMLVFGDTKSLYTTPDGDAFGWRPDGSFVDDFPGAVALTPFAGVITETFSVPMAFTNTVPAPSVEILSQGGDVGFFAANNGHVMQIKTPATDTGTTANVAVLYDKSQLSGFRYTSEQAAPKTEPSIGMVLGERERAVFRWGGLSVTANGSLGFLALDGLRGVAYENGTARATQHMLTIDTVDGYQGVSGAHIFGPFTIPPGAHHQTFIEDWPTSSRLRSEIDLDGDGVPDKTETVIGVPCQMTDIDNDEAPDICVLNPIYMPQIGAHGNANPVNNQPDLEGSLRVIPDKKSFTAGEPVVIQATVTNRGMEKTGPFWVDLFINPAQPPTAANMLWNKSCGMNPCFGIAWYVSKGLQPGDSIVLNSTSASFGERFTSWPGWFARGTTDLYLYVDSYGLSSPDGAVKESNETNNRFEVHELTVTGVNPAQSLALPAAQRE